MMKEPSQYPTNNLMNIPDAVLDAASKLEGDGFRFVRIIPKGAEVSLGFTVHLCKRIKTGLRIAKVDLDPNGNLTPQA